MWNEKNFPNWLMVAILVGLGELSYWLNTRFGFGVATKAALGVTALAGIWFLILFIGRWRRNFR